ncbi:MAG: hypothetical protein WD010_03465 [Nitriliruptor sp.]|uniref:hypothetical protein n=1 Tax=Nitriliruptor sp. TaxID=2448056 RepID=UPI0034A05E88
MSRSLRHFLPVEVAALVGASLFTGDPEEWLPDARRVGADRYAIEVGTGAISRQVTVTIGDPWHVGSTWWRSCSWEATGGDGEPGGSARFLPRLDAELGLAVHEGRATLLLDGRYDPPGGRIGEAVDAVALNRVARTTVDRLLAQIVRQLTARSLATL